MASIKRRKPEPLTLGEIRAAEEKARGWDKLLPAADNTEVSEAPAPFARRGTTVGLFGVSSADRHPVSARRAGFLAGARSDGDSPPRVTRGEHSEEAPAVEHPPEFVDLVLEGGVVKQVMKRTGLDGSTAFIDWLHITMHEDTAHVCGWSGSSLTDEDIVSSLSFALDSIFGYGVTGKFDKGRNFYRRSYELGDGYGALMHGGQRDTVMIQITGTGLAAAKLGWEYRLLSFLESIAVNPRITRVDVAHDCFDGEYTPEQASDDYDRGLFRLSRSPKNPDCEQRGNWKHQNSKGRTFNVGVRTSGKYARVYEKGRQLGDKQSKWVRIEVEFKGIDRVIPFDVLIHPGCYLSGSYPAFDFINASQDRIKTVREQKVCEKTAKEEWITTVAGPDLYVLLELEDGDTPEARALNLINRLKNESKLPKWALIPDFRFSPKGIHKNIAPDGGPVSETAIYAALEKLEI